MSVYFQTAHLSYNIIFFFVKTALRKDTKLPSCGVYEEGDCTLSFSIKFNVQTTKFPHSMWMQMQSRQAKILPINCTHCISTASHFEDLEAPMTLLLFSCNFHVFKIKYIQKTLQVRNKFMKTIHMFCLVSCSSRLQSKNRYNCN